MSKITNFHVYQVDAFTDRAFRGNPAAVMPLDSFLPDPVLQAIAEENALSETAFVVPRGDEYDLRWFTPKNEVDLCGHATLATALVLLRVLRRTTATLRFHTRSGLLVVRPEGPGFVLDFPVRESPVHDGDRAALAAALGREPLEVVGNENVIATLERAEDVRALAPDLGRLAALPARTVAVTAPGTGKDVDVAFVSRMFAPREGIPEDPVTGSLHCALAPLWAARLGATTFRARQVSRRGGELRVSLRGERVEIFGQGVLVKSGELHLATGDGSPASARFSGE